MFKPSSLYIGLRYSQARKNSYFVSFISFLSIVGLALGVMAMIIVLSVMNGFQKEMQGRILGIVPHILIKSDDGFIKDWKKYATQLEENKEITAIAPFAKLEGMLSHHGNIQPVEINGISTDFISKTSIIPEHMKYGSIDSLSDKGNQIVLGDILANQLDVSMGDSVLLIVPDTNSSVTTKVVPKIKRFIVSGIYSIGVQQDASLAIINLETASELLSFPDSSIQSIQVSVKNILESNFLAKKFINSLNDSFYFEDWSFTEGSLFQAMQMEKVMVGFLLFLIIAVAAFNIIAMLIMIVSDKKSDIAILKTIGFSRKKIMMIFISQGTLIGVLGTIIGCFFGLISAYYITPIVAFIEGLLGLRVFTSDLYFVNYLPTEIIFSDVLIVSFSAILICFLATIYPAYKASNILPVEGLRDK